MKIEDLKKVINELPGNFEIYFNYNFQPEEVSVNFDREIITFIIKNSNDKSEGK